MKPAYSTTPRTAIAINPATRETALLMPDATPAWSWATEFITVVVSGATLIAMPKPSTITAGKKVLQYEPPMPGLANSAKPTAATSGPMISGRLAP